MFSTFCLRSPNIIFFLLLHLFSWSLYFLDSAYKKLEDELEQERREKQKLEKEAKQREEDLKQLEKVSSKESAYVDFIFPLPSVAHFCNVFSLVINHCCT